MQIRQSSYLEAQGASTLQKSGSGAPLLSSSSTLARESLRSFDQVLEQKRVEPAESPSRQASKGPAGVERERRNDDASPPKHVESPLERPQPRLESQSRAHTRPEREDRGRPGRDENRPAPHSADPASEDGEASETEEETPAASVVEHMAALGGIFLPDLRAVLGGHPARSDGGYGQGLGDSLGGRLGGGNAGRPSFFAPGGPASGQSEHLGGLTAGPRPAAGALLAHPFQALRAGAEVAQALAANGLSSAAENGNLGILESNSAEAAANGTDPATHSTGNAGADAAAMAAREQKPASSEKAAALEPSSTSAESFDGAPIVVEIQGGQAEGGDVSDQGLQNGGSDAQRLAQQVQQESAVAFSRELEAAAQPTQETSHLEGSGWVTRLGGAIGQALSQQDERLSARLELDDPDLGRIRLELHLEGGKVRVELVAEREQTRQLLKEGRQALEQELAKNQQQLSHYSVGDDGSRNARGFGAFRDGTGRDEGLRARAGRSGAQGGSSQVEAALSKGRRVHEGQLDIIA